ncbi:hypothetical protein LWI29_032475 [Acer saccharum]|uniref:DNA polymerase alpha catalytic subunit N-terminal domain-containing protein n=1 Tax=Acer saccharum TaxID=4024 RepID=A0AA39TJC9_ACESA|nr:hypothetical protein LWI29_032475 [Acer saccharum]
MTDEQPTTGGRRRGRGAEASARSEALERLKALRQGGRRSGDSGKYDIKLENPIYDTVEEDEYDALVARRREEARGFIVDDDGLGYGDEGQEEDWSIAGVLSSSDDELTEGQKSIKKKKVEKKEKKENGQHVKRSNPSLTAAAAMMGKQRLSAMFTSSTMFKKAKDDKVKESESVVDDVIAEFAPDDTDRERRRRTPLVSVPINNKSSVPINNKSFVPINSFKSESQKCINSSNSEQKQESNVVMDSVQEQKLEAVEEMCLIKESEESKLECDVSAELIKVDAIQVKEEEKEDSYKLNAKISTEEKDPALSASAGWKAVISNNAVADEVKNGLNSDEQSDFEVDADGSLPFYILDAHEQFSGANMGTVYLFGKVM